MSAICTCVLLLLISLNCFIYLRIFRKRNLCFLLIISDTSTEYNVYLLFLIPNFLSISLKFFSAKLLLCFILSLLISSISTLKLLFYLCLQVIKYLCASCLCSFLVVVESCFAESEVSL